MGSLPSISLKYATSLQWVGDWSKLLETLCTGTSCTVILNSVTKKEIVFYFDRLSCHNFNLKYPIYHTGFLMPSNCNLLWHGTDRLQDVREFSELLILIKSNKQPRKLILSDNKINKCLIQWRYEGVAEFRMDCDGFVVFTKYPDLLYLDTCSSWAAVGGGLDPFDTYNLTSGDPSFWGNKSTVQSTPTVWGWVTSSNLRIGLFFTAVFASVIALACVIYHVGPTPHSNWPVDDLTTPPWGSADGGGVPLKLDSAFLHRLVFGVLYRINRGW